MSATATNSSASGEQFRRETLNGTDYLVAPVVAIQEGVYLYPRQNGRGIKREFLPSEEIANSTTDWEDTPLTLSHPKDEDGKPGLVANSRTEETIVGKFKNVANKKSALIGETWIKTNEVGEHGGRLEDYVNAVENGNPQEVSTGYRAGTEFERGTYENQQYTYVQRSPEPDHLALLTEERGNCSVAEGCGTGATLNQMPYASDEGVRVNHRRMTTNVTPEQIEIVEDVVDEFTQSQGNATLSEMRTWIQENDDLDADDKTAIRAMLSDVFEHNPEDWRVEGEFSAWLDRRAEQERANTLGDISEPAGVLTVNEGLSSDDESDTVINLLGGIHETLNRALGSGDEPTGDMEPEKTGETGPGAESTSDLEQDKPMTDTIETLVNEHGLSESTAEALEGTECAENILNWAEEAEGQEPTEGGSDGGTEEIANEQIEALRDEFEQKFDEQEDTINELQEELEAERREKEEQINQRLNEHTELGEATIESMGLEEKEAVANELGVPDEDEQAESRSNFSGIRGQTDYDYDSGSDDDLDIPVAGRANASTEEE